MSSSKNGVAAKELERQVGVTYKTAWRMAHQIRKFMATDGGILNGIVEADETFIGGLSKNMHRAKRLAAIKGPEGFWSQLKRSISGTFHHISKRHLQKYVNDFVYRYNHRGSEQPIFYDLSARLAEQHG